MSETSIKKSELKPPKNSCCWPLGLGILLIVLGIWAAGYSIFVGVIAIIWFGKIKPGINNSD